MFLFVDESEGGIKKVIGGILLPIDKVCEVERDLVNERIKAKLFGEIKWSSVSGTTYHQAYLNTLDLFWKEREATYHSCSYRRREDRYKAAYMLIRAVSWKIEKHYGSRRTPPMYILFDYGGSFGTTFFPRIKQMLSRDPSFHLQVAFCNHGHSHIMGGLQISDLLTGAVAARINAVSLSKYPKEILSSIETNNGGPIGVGISRFPRLYEFKMHHYDLVRLVPTVV